MNYKLLSALLCIVVVVGGLVYVLSPEPAQTEFTELGAEALTTITNPFRFTKAVTVVGTTTVGSLTQGGGVFATTSVAAATFTCAQIGTANLIQQTNTAAVTLTLPASSTCPSTFIPTAGQSKTLYLANLGNSLITLAGGSGTLLNVASTSGGVGANAKTIFSDGVARLDFIRTSSTNIEVILTPARQ